MNIFEILKNKLFIKHFFKVITPMLILLVLYLFFVFGIIIPTLEKNLYNEKTETTKRLAELLYSDLVSRQAEIDQGLISMAEHQKRVLSRYEKLRFGKNNSDYFWILDERGYIIMHPYVKSIVNVNPDSVKGPDGKQLRILLRKMQSVVIANGSGIVEYYWQFNDNPNILTKKMSYVKKFEPWNWIIGAGVYIDDIERDIAHWRNKLILVGLILVFITIIINLFISLKSVRSKIEEELANKDLKESEETFRKIFEESSDAIIIMDYDTFIDCNQSALNMFHLSNKSELIGTQPEDFSPQYQVNQILSSDMAKSIYKEAAEKGFCRFEWIHKKSTGELFNADISMTQIYIKNKSLFYVLLRDITHIKTIQTELKESEERTKTTLMSIADAVISTDIYGNVYQMNYSAEKLIGLKFDYIHKYHIRDLLKVKVSEIDQYLFEKYYLYKDTINYLMNHDQYFLYSEDGNKYRVIINVSTIMGENQTNQGLVFVIKDVTQEYTLQQDKEERDLLFKTIFDISPFFIIIQKLEDMSYMLVNKAFLESRDLLENEVIGKKPIDIGIATDDEDRHNFDILLRNGSVDNVIKMSKRNNRNRYVLFSSRIINYKNQLCSFTIANDITEIRELQEQLTHAQKMDAIGQLAGGIAHDFNNIIGGILGIVELMTMKEYSFEDRQKNLQMILSSGKRAADLTKKLLVFARKGKIDSSPVDVHKAINDAIALLDRTINKKVLLEKDLNASSSMIIGDYSQLMNIFLNMGINADHAMPDGGKLTYHTSEIILDEEFCRNTYFDIKEGTYIMIQIKDTGQGIHPDNISRIFEPFFTTKEQGKGTGLGLAAVYGTITQHHGAIFVESVLNEGTVFNVYLPLADVEESVQDKKLKYITGSGTILIVDDEYIIQVMAKAILENLGYSVLVASNGLEALEVYQQYSQQIKLVILDMVMPEMNGKECFAKLKKIDPQVKVILSSGFTQEEDLSDMKKLGLNGFIRKPYNTLDISHLINEVLSQ